MANFFEHPNENNRRTIKVMRQLRIPLRVVFYREREGDAWIAHCLEFDLAGDGMSKEAALANLIEAIGCQIEASLKFDNPATLFTPADGRIFEMFAVGTDIAQGQVHLNFEQISIQGTEFREYQSDINDCGLMAHA